MLEQISMMEALYKGILPTMQSCGFEPVIPSGTHTAVYQRGEGSVMDFAGEKGKLRLVFSTNRIHLLSAAAQTDGSDDSAYDIVSTYLMELEEYEERDVKRLITELCDQLNESYAKKAKITSKKQIQTVSRTSAKSGVMAYDPVTLASKLGGMFPEIKDEIKLNLDTYGEFLCETFFTGKISELILQVIKENNPQKMKKLFNILGETYEDGTNEVQSLIAVTVLGPVKDDPILVQNMMPYLTDTMLEPVLSVGQRLKKSRSANLRLENPPKYKPKKQKSPGFLSQLLGVGYPGGQPLQ